MKQPLIHSLVLVALVPLITMALEPNNPKGLCDRFINDKDIEKCQERTKQEDVDWYAATVCNLQTENESFWNCWDSIKGKSFNPALLDHCSEDKDLDDSKRLTCLKSAITERSPETKNSPNKIFQPLAK